MRLKGYQLALNFEYERLYWRLVLRPAVATAKPPTSLGLVFRDTIVLQLRQLVVSTAYNMRVNFIISLMKISVNSSSNTLSGKIKFPLAPKA
jgi:hypothetical protein